MKCKGIFMICALFVAALYTALSGIWNYFSYSFPDATSQISNSLKFNVNFYDFPNQNENTENTSLEPQANLPASSSKDALGKIISRFISPYGANTSFQNINLKNNTSANINLQNLLNNNLGIKISQNSTPQVLIYHTHTTESYMLEERDYYTENDLSRRLENDKNMVFIGDIFEAKLRAAGIGVIHDTTLHDYPSYSGSYDRSAKSVEADLKVYKDIKIIIDIHRDAISDGESDKAKPIITINGQNYAQVMLVMGSQTGSIKNHKNWQNNLSLAVKYQQKMEEMYPGLARAITLNEAKYNQNLSSGALLLEVGSDANTLDEAKRGATAAADALVNLLYTMK